MPARPFVPGVCQVLWRGSFGPSYKWLNKLFVSYSGAAPTATALDAYAVQVLTSLQTNLTPLQHVSSQIDDVEVTDLASALGAVGVNTGITNGSRAGSEIPGSTCALLSWHVSRHFRGGHPRTYLVAGVQADLSSPSTWGADFVTAVHTAALAIITDMLTAVAGFTPVAHVNVSYFGGAPTIAKKSQPRLVPLVDVIAPSGLTVEPELASQRRRIGRK